MKEVNKQVRDQFDKQVLDQVQNQVEDQVERQVWDQIYYEVLIDHPDRRQACHRVHWQVLDKVKEDLI